MSLNKNDLMTLAKVDAKAYFNPSSTFSIGEEKLNAEAIHTTYANELKEISDTPAKFRENQNLIFNLIEVGITEVLPTRVLQKYGDFADVQHYNNNDKPVFRIRISEASKRRAKQFVTKVGLAGRYETFKLDGYQFEIPVSTIGGAARVEWEEILSGTFSLADYYNLILEGIDEAIYREIAKALKAAASNVKTVNKFVSNTFNEAQMDRLLATADAYGMSTIYCTYEFAAKMLPIASNATNWNAMSDSMKDHYWNNGAFTTYKGHKVIILPQSFETADNATKVIDPSLAYIIPTGSEKPVKVAFVGSAQTKSFENRDWSTEINTYQKVGVATYLVNPGFCVYQNTSCSKTNAGSSTESEYTIV